MQDIHCQDKKLNIDENYVNHMITYFKIAIRTNVFIHSISK